MIILKGQVPHTTVSSPHKATQNHKKKKQLKKKYNKRKLSLPVLNKGKPKLVLSCLIISRGEREGVLNKFLCGEALPEVQPLPFYIPFFHEKRYPFHITSVDKWYRFYILSLELCIQCIVI